MIPDRLPCNVQLEMHTICETRLPCYVGVMWYLLAVFRYNWYNSLSYLLPSKLVNPFILHFVVDGSYKDQFNDIFRCQLTVELYIKLVVNVQLISLGMCWEAVHCQVLRYEDMLHSDQMLNWTIVTVPESGPPTGMSADLLTWMLAPLVVNYILFIVM
jgi:hypothetical protein